mmetsp:Transcript_26706/g.50400  ORF Transcript_26706/g.50400 Transcript_26706/m.50400 type:complete len:372 (-) Transcript_26706:166-1281(-)|eukprot:scaffold492_cov99-Amphora_coffeaeformis.AAC.6
MLGEEILFRHLNGASAADGFLNGAEFQNVTNGGETSDNGDEDGTTAPVYATAFIYLAGLFIGVFALVLITWLVAYIADHWCGCLPWCHSLEYHGSMDNNWDKSGLARRARLFGLTLPERRQILQHYIFEETTVYVVADKNNTTSEGSATDIESGLSAAPREEMKGVKEGEEESTNTEQQQQQQQEDPLDDADHERLCCICLAQYQERDRLLRGKLCGHQFHYNCSMDWLMKPHDNCPYCRELLVSVQDFRQGAIQCLGIKRVESLTGGVNAGTVEMTIPVAAPPPATAPTTTEVPRSNMDGTPDETTEMVTFAAGPVDTTTTAEPLHAACASVSDDSITVPTGSIVGETTNAVTDGESALTNDKEGVPPRL